MQKLFFCSVSVLVCLFSIGQLRRGLVVPPSLLPTNSPSQGSREPIDKNSYKDPKLLDLQSKFNSLLNPSSLNSAYPIVDISTQNNFTDTLSFSSVSNIKLIDARFDTEKNGFLPVGLDIQKKGYNILGFQINKNIVSWLAKDFIEKNMATDSSSKRQLVIVLQKFWFSNSVSDHYSASNPKLLTTLYYHFDLYTSRNTGYYPQKKIAGSFTALYKNGKAYNELTDSILVLLKKELLSQNFGATETEANWQSPVDFNDYNNTRTRQAAQFEKMPKGIYATYADFLEKKTMCDSVEMTVKYNNYDREQLYACQLVAFQDGLHRACNQAWGYFDGSSIFLNTSNGFFLKLFRSKEDYVFFHLKNLHEERIKQDMLESIQIGNSHYQLLKDYTKVFALTYQLDKETGKLY